MNELFFSLNTIIPLFICCLAGYTMRRHGYVGESFVKDCSNVVFYIAIPCNIFNSVVKSDFSNVIDPKLILFLIVGSSFVALSALAVCNRLISERKTAATVAHNIFRGNFTLLGIPLATSLLGEEGAAAMMILIPFGILCSNVYSVIILSSIPTKSKENFFKTSIRSAGEILKNPMTIGSILGILVAWIGIPLPQIVSSTVDTFAKMCSGLALFMLGAQLELSDILKSWKYTFWTTLVRLLISPLIMIGIASFLGFRGNSLAALFIYFASPTAVTCYVLAEKMGGDSKLAGDAVLATSCLSTFSLMLGIFILKSLRLI